jgi:hypothetical protein
MPAARVTGHRQSLPRGQVAAADSSAPPLAVRLRAGGGSEPAAIRGRRMQSRAVGSAVGRSSPAARAAPGGAMGPVEEAVEAIDAR